MFQLKDITNIYYNNQNHNVSPLTKKCSQLSLTDMDYKSTDDHNGKLVI